MSAFIDAVIWPEISELYTEGHIDKEALLTISNLLGDLEKHLTETYQKCCNHNGQAA